MKQKRILEGPQFLKKILLKLASTLTTNLMQKEKSLGFSQVGIVNLVDFPPQIYLVHPHRLCGSARLYDILKTHRIF